MEVTKSDARIRRVTVNNAPLTDMIDALLDGWTEEVSWAEAVAEHDAACLAAQLSLTVQQLRLHECECPRRTEFRKESRTRIPLLTQLAESKWIVRTGGGDGNDGGKVKRLHPPVPGGLEAADEVMRNIEFAVDIICRDWQLVEECGADIGSRLEAVRREMGARLMPEVDDAAAVLAPGFRAARIHLGYDRRLQGLVCGCGGAIALQDTLATCEGACGASYGFAEVVQRGAVERCKRGHKPDWRMTPNGSWQCRPCEASRKRRSAAIKRREEAALDTAAGI